jgi:PAS domain S-box-containing protein
VDEAEQRFFINAVDMLCHLDFSGYFRRLNPAWERALGFSREELMARPFIEFVHPDDRERTLAQNQRVRGGDQALSFENRYLCKHGGYRWLRWNASPDPSHRTIYSVARDVTAAKEAEAEREALLTGLQEAMAEVKALQGILPICSYCRKVRDDENYWHSVENYLALHTNTRLSHGICPSCMASEMEPQLRALEDDDTPA